MMTCFLRRSLLAACAAAAVAVLAAASSLEGRAALAEEASDLAAAALQRQRKKGFAASSAAASAVAAEHSLLRREIESDAEAVFDARRSGNGTLDASDSLAEEKPWQSSKLQKDQERCYQPRDIAYIQGDLSANAVFWLRKCKVLTKDTHSIRVKMGEFTDYYKPRQGASWCRMLQSSDQHLWSHDAKTFQAPIYHANANFLGGSEEGFPAQVGSAGRKFLSFWGAQGNQGGCCGEGGDANWGQVHLVSACARCGGLAMIYGGRSANKAYWQAVCDAGTLPGSAKMIRVTIGAAVDWFRPTEGNSLCDMLLANDKHMWSHDGLTWKVPTYYDSTEHLGGSAAGWPQENGFARRFLNFWGSEAHMGGCCSPSLRDECGEDENMKDCFGRVVKVEYCRGK